MTELREPPRLRWPTTAVRESYLAGERADCLLGGTPTDRLRDAERDFAAFVAQRRGVHTWWGVPSTVFWYVSDEHYLAALPPCDPGQRRGAGRSGAWRGSVLD